MNKQIKSSLILLLASIIWGTAFVAQCSVDSAALGNFSFNGIRFLLGCVSLIPVVLIFERRLPNKRTVKGAILSGIALFSASAFQMAGIELTHSASKSGFITGMYTILVPFIAWIVLKKKTNLFTWIAAVLSVIGLYLLSGGIDKIEYGDILVLVSTLFWAVQILLVDHFTDGCDDPIKFSFLQFLTCGILHMLFACFFEKITLDGISANMIPILYTGILSTGVAYTCQVIGQKHANPTLASIIMSSEGVFAAIGGVIILHEAMTFQTFCGCLLMFSGIVLSQFKFTKKGDKINVAQ